MTNKALARTLKETAQLIELTGGNPFRSRAFENAARVIERLEDPVPDLVASGVLTNLRGIGGGLAKDVKALLERGSFDLRDDLLASIPPGLLDVLRIKGLGAKKVRVLWQTLGVISLDTLEHAAQTGQVADLKGFGHKTQENILDQLAQLKRYMERRRFADAYQIGLPLLEALRALDDVHQAEWTGEMRRQLETVASIEFLAAASSWQALTPFLETALPDAELLPPADDLEALQAHLGDGFRILLYRSPPATFGTRWWYSTGSEAHCSAFEARFGPPGKVADEQAVYANAGLAFIPPELREHQGELEAATRQALPDLIRVEDLKGALHNHSTYSDGTHTLQQMAGHARAMGLTYFGICDHSQSLTIANGLSIERVEAQQAEIEALNDVFNRDPTSPFRIFSGIESDILADGSLDYPDDVLHSFDFVVASIHSRFNMTEAEATDRLIRAIEHPATTILGHPTGRLLLVREGYPIAPRRVIDACAANGVALELNANPYRLDIDWRWIRTAADQGVLISINPDAHSMEQLAYVEWGVRVARKGWLTADQCLNAKGLDEFTAWLTGR